jgi:tRNA pseudouridine55 synthase
LARQGRPPELAARTVTIFDLRVEQYRYPELSLSIECGSGMYVRALGRDLAAALGTTAVMSALRRMSIGGFCVEDALAFDEITPGSLRRCLKPPLSAVGDMPRLAVSDADVVEIRHGRPIELRQLEVPAAEATSPFRGTEEWAAVDGAGRLLAILREKRTDQLWPEINFDVDPASRDSSDHR